MSRTRHQIMLELRTLRTELRLAKDDSDARRIALLSIDSLLDERLEQRGAHPADCCCGDCQRQVADVLVRAADVASVEDWGPMSVAPE